MNIFWNTIANYNLATWIYQIIFITVGILLTLLLIYKPSRIIKTGMKIYLTTTYLWISLIYYYIFCAERSYNIAMVLYWGIMAIIWLWDTISGYTTFESTGKHRPLSIILLILPFIYPIFSLARGMSFPAMTSPVMPCSVAVFTLGLMLMFSRKINMFIVLFLCHWSFIGVSKTYSFDIPEDFLLSGATIPAIYFFLKDFFLKQSSSDTKPQGKYINLLLLLVCSILATALIVALGMEIKLNP